MRKTLQLLATILITFILPLLTSWLLDWTWIAESWPRYCLVIILMLLEFVIGGYIVKLIATHKPER